MTINSIRNHLQQLRLEVAKEDRDSPLRHTLLEKIDELKKDYDEVIYEMKKPDDIRLAELLHSKLCHWNHTDGCGWHYGAWDKIPLEHSRDEYLRRARRILEDFTFDQAVKFVELMK